jgi:hypothetical protein
MDFIYYMKSNKENSCNCFKWGGKGLAGRDGGGDLTMHNISLFGIVTMNLPLYNEYILI